MPLATIRDVKARPKPVVLVILDGWGVSPSWGGNAVSISNPPTYQYLWSHYPHTLLQAFKAVVGPDGLVGSSEIGHATIGSGRIVDQDLTEINLLIGNGQFFTNPTLRQAMLAARTGKHAVHLIGLLSEGRIHASAAHAQALVRLAKQLGVTELYIHVITDGRDAETQGAQRYVTELAQFCQEEGIGEIATVLGRFYAMDRSGQWPRTEVAYQALTLGSERTAPSARAAIAQGYKEGYDDEHLPPMVIDLGGGSLPASEAGSSRGRIRPGDTLVSWNIRADRMQQLIQAFTDPHVLRTFGIWRRYPLLGVQCVTLTDYHLRLPGLVVAFPSAVIESTLGQLLANHTFTQLHIAEREKQAHVTYFFNGGRVDPYEGETRQIFRSPNVSSYDRVPAMSAGPITRAAVRAIAARSFDFLLINYANVDMVAHTGNLAATSRAVLVVDEALRQLANVVLDVGGVLLITADHGNAESVATLRKGDRETLHTQSPVPFIYVSRATERQSRSLPIDSRSVISTLLGGGRTLADVAPTILELFGIPKPSDMTGTSLLGELD